MHYLNTICPFIICLIYCVTILREGMLYEFRLLSISFTATFQSHSVKCITEWRKENIKSAKKRARIFLNFYSLPLFKLKTKIQRYICLLNHYSFSASLSFIYLLTWSFLNPLCYLLFTYTSVREVTNLHSRNLFFIFSGLLLYYLPQI